VLESRELLAWMLSLTRKRDGLNLKSNYSGEWFQDFKIFSNDIVMCENSFINLTSNHPVLLNREINSFGSHYQIYKDFTLLALEIYSKICNENCKRKFSLVKEFHGNLPSKIKESTLTVCLDLNLIKDQRKDGALVLRSITWKDTSIISRRNIQ
jgi:hypothetical protein